MSKWSLVLITFGLISIMYASSFTPTSFGFVISGILYVVLGCYLYYRSSKKKGVK
ncbi:MAG: hypothetical protein GX760_02335 [Erysipelothrix sp.]|nr:hypothetical protein [Erysipelothrix sp.]